MVDVREKSLHRMNPEPTARKILIFFVVTIEEGLETSVNACHGHVINNIRSSHLSRPPWLVFFIQKSKRRLLIQSEPRWQILQIPINTLVNT